jgi:SAM-dependent methyltransferase
VGARSVPDYSACLPTWLAPLHAATCQYYGAKVDRYGPTPRGVDWNCAATQDLRFLQLLKTCGARRAFSLNDLGCGYGALLAYVLKHHPRVQLDYLGVDLSEQMIGHAKRLWSNRPDVRFVHGDRSSRIADYSIASGIFNVRLGHPRRVWERLVAVTLLAMRDTSRIAFAVNFMAPLPDGSTDEPNLYRTPPQRWADFCERRLGCSVEITQGYGLREFTLSARMRAGARRVRRGRSDAINVASGSTPGAVLHRAAAGK